MSTTLDPDVVELTDTLASDGAFWPHELVRPIPNFDDTPTYAPPAVEDAYGPCAFYHGDGIARPATVTVYFGIAHGPTPSSAFHKAVERFDLSDILYAQCCTACRDRFTVEPTVPLYLHEFGRGLDRWSCLFWGLKK